MKRLTKIELYGIVFGIALFVFGVVQIIWPKARVMTLATNGRLGNPGTAKPLVITTTGARVYGLLEILGGAGIVVLSAYRVKR
jgi:hypothetical protein